MNGYQLACGHWRSALPGDRIGGLSPCVPCNRLHVEIIGITQAAEFMVAVQ